MLYTRRTFDFEYKPEEADAVLLGIPWDSTSTGRPVRYGPLFIRQAIRELVGWDPETRFNPFEKLKLADLGDLEVVEGDWRETEKRIIDTLKGVRFPVILGGDHLISLGVVRALKPKAIVQLDAHPDMHPEWMGNPFTHLTWAWHASKICPVYQPACRIWAEDEKVRKGLPKKGPVYLTIDLDVLDPREAPEVGNPEPGGLTWEELLEIVRRICKLGLIGFDLVECAADRVGSQTACRAANLFKKILCYLWHEKG